jgi:hypothetical protein
MSREGLVKGGREIAALPAVLILPPARREMALGDRFGTPFALSLHSDSSDPGLNFALGGAAMPDRTRDGLKGFPQAVAAAFCQTNEVCRFNSLGRRDRTNEDTGLTSHVDTGRGRQEKPIGMS